MAKGRKRAMDLICLGKLFPSIHTADAGLSCSWHQDINPTNILVKSRPNALCPYDVHFKIADLGLSHFKRHTSGLGSATDKDTFGTRAYGRLI